MTSFERIPKLVEFCIKVSSNFTGVKDNNVEYVRDNLIKVNDCSFLLMDDVGELLVYPGKSEEPVLIVRITESIRVSLDFVSVEPEIGGIWSQDNSDKEYKNCSRKVFTRTLEEMGVSQASFAKYIVKAGMPVEEN